jgi:hypothetical protein
MGNRGRASLCCLLAVALASQAGAEEAFLTLTDGSVAIEVSAVDVAEIDISELGGFTDVFVTLMPRAGVLLAQAPFAEGTRLAVGFCGIAMATPPVRPPLTGHVYIAETSLARAEALRAVWQGRARCDTLGPEVFEHGQ